MEDGSFAYLVKLVSMLAGNAVILVIHRGQHDPENEEKIMSISPASGFASGLHLGTQAIKLHLLQLLAYGRYGETPKLLSDSETNRQNQQLLFNLLQEVLQVIAFMYISLCLCNGLIGFIVIKQIGVYLAVRYSIVCSRVFCAAAQRPKDIADIAPAYFWQLQINRLCFPLRSGQLIRGVLYSSALKTRVASHHSAQ